MFREIAYEMLPYQEPFQESEKNKAYLSAGYGAGKTYSLVMKMFKLASVNYGLPGGMLCPTLKMFKRDVLPTVREICDENGIPYQYNGQDQFFYFPDTKTTVYVFHSEDDGRSIKGPNLAFMLINEVTLCSEGAFKAAIARVRLKKARLLQTAMSGTPEEFNWAYEYFIEKPRTDTDLIFGDMRLNTYNHEAYAQMLIESYDHIMVQQYVEGKYVPISGNRALYAFDRFKHVAKEPLERIEHLPVWVTLDFNLNPMAATLFNRMPLDSRVKLRSFGELAISGSNTHEMAESIIREVGLSAGEITIFPDPAGAGGSTKSRGKSDIDILRDYGFKDIRHKASITSVRDCLNAANNMFSKGMVEISPTCRNFIADAEQCKLKQGSSEIDKTNPKRSHWLDGFKDMADYEFPARKPHASYREVTIR